MLDIEKKLIVHLLLLLQLTVFAVEHTGDVPADGRKDKRDEHHQILHAEILRGKRADAHDEQYGDTYQRVNTVSDDEQLQLFGKLYIIDFLKPSIDFLSLALKIALLQQAVLLFVYNSVFEEAVKLLKPVRGVVVVGCVFALAALL